MVNEITSTAILFQPTLPARGETFFSASHGHSFVFQPTLPARGETHLG